MNLRFKGLLKRKKDQSSIAEHLIKKEKRKKKLKKKNKKKHQNSIRSNFWSSRFLHLLRKKQKPSPIFIICIIKTYLYVKI